MTTEQPHRYRSPMVPFKVCWPRSATVREDRQILGNEWAMLVARVTEDVFAPSHLLGAKYLESLEVHRIDLAPPLQTKSASGAVQSQTWSDNWAPYIEAGGVLLSTMMAPCEPLPIPKLSRYWSIRLFVRNSSCVALTVGLVLSESRNQALLARHYPDRIGVDRLADWQLEEKRDG